MAGVYLQAGDFAPDYITSSIASAADQVLFNIAVRHGDEDDPYKNNPGRGYSVLEAGRGRLPNLATEDEATLWAYVRRQFEIGSALCESPIEREMLAALLTADWTFAEVHTPSIHIGTLDDLPLSGVWFIPQLVVARCRVDLAICLSDRVFAIECDGADFHDRRQDELRDHYLEWHGVQSIHLSGALIRKAPLAAADLIAMSLGIVT